MNGTNESAEPTLFAQELLAFVAIYEQFYEFAQNFELVLLAFGITGNVTAVLTLYSSRRMRSPSYMYHRTLVVSDLFLCLNYMCLKIVDGHCTTRSNTEQYVFANWMSAYYSGVLKGVISSVCGYVAMYMSLLITWDRFAGMMLYAYYPHFNRHTIARRLILMTVAFSVAIHSWTAWVRALVVEYDSRNCTGYCTFYTWIHNIHQDGITDTLMTASSIYNLVVRLTALALLTTFSVSVIVSFVRIRNKRKRLLSITCQENMKTEKLRSSSLFYLMSVVVFLEYVEKIPREIKRLFELVYPQSYVLDKMRDHKLPNDERLYYVKILLYLYNFSKILLNLLVLIKSSMIFYCYLGFNYLFRHETIILIKRLPLICRRCINVCRTR